MNARDAFLSRAGRVLFALPPRAQRVLGGRMPLDAAGLEPDAWLVALFDRRFAAGPPGSEPLAESRERFAREVMKVSVRPRVPVAASDATVAGAAGPLAARLYVPAEAPERGPSNDPSERSLGGEQFERKIARILDRFVFRLGGLKLFA